MKAIYLIKVEGEMRPVIADLGNVHQGVAWVNRINVPQPLRGKGWGTKILEMILKDADKEYVTLRLEPLATGGLSQDSLVKWYTRNGFDWKVDEVSGHRWLERLPQ